jgi:rhamnulokinase
MSNYYLAIDIGASSGRHILSHLNNGKMELEEIHRFENGMNDVNGELCWNWEELFAEIKTGLKKCKELGKIPVSVGIDTWAVDFVLLDKEDKVLGNMTGYRDGRTIGMDEKVYSMMPEEELYNRTGIQKQIFNTIFQLMAVKEKHPEHLNKAATMLMVPDYFNFLLCGVKRTEYTNATTTQLVSPKDKNWDKELIRLLGFPEQIFTPIGVPGTILGDLTKEVQEEVGFNCKVVLPATHDTGSAVLAVPSNSPDSLYISSGTWSLMGIEQFTANCSRQSKNRNFTNEGGYDYRFRFLKNIMGLWMIQSVKKEIGGELSFGEICDNASKEGIPSLVNCNDSRFLAPKNMTEEVQLACKESNQQIPQGISEVAAVIYNSLANCYRDTIHEIEEVTGRKFDSIHIVGGGSNAEYLNKLTAKATNSTVYAGPTEATAIGNLMVQMISAGELADLHAARELVFESFEIKKFEP